MDDKKKIINNGEIDLVALVNYFWSNRWFVVKFSSIFVVLGLIIALTSQKQYVTVCRVLPEAVGSGMKAGGAGISALAGLAGVNLNLGQSETLTPIHYPEIINSAPFLNDLLKEPVYFEKLDTTISTFEYYRDFQKPSLPDILIGYTLGLPGKIKSIFVDKEEPIIDLGKGGERRVLSFSENDWETIKAFRDLITVETDYNTGMITVELLYPDRYAVADLTGIMVDKLTEKVTEYKIQKAQQNLDFVQERYDDAQEKYQQCQLAVARYNELNRNLASPTSKIRLQQLNNDLSLALSLYRDLASQLEQAKIKVKYDTPVFTVVQPAIVPIDKEKPKRLLILIGFTFLGGFIAIVRLLLRLKNN
ncbi:MAG: Wzz/FepE/Etk N-terminal domain-containing protein [Bacteroidota bacterium]